MYSENTNEKEFFRNINKRNLGDKYSEVMKDLNKEEGVLKPVVNRSSTLWLLGLGIAAAGLILIFSKTCSVLPAPSAQDIGFLALVENANKPLHILEHDTDRGGEKDANADLLRAAMSAYNRPDYQHAFVLFDSLSLKDSNKISYDLFAADCQSKLKDYGAAIKGFEKTLKKSKEAGQNDYQYCAAFYLGINQILSGDYRSGIATLRPLASYGFKQKEVQAILKDTL